MSYQKALTINRVICDKFRGTNRDNTFTDDSINNLPHPSQDKVHEEETCRMALRRFFAELPYPARKEKKDYRYMTLVWGPAR